MKPTFYLRYIKVDYNNSIPLTTSFSFGESEYYRLQQWWENENGEGEWRFIEKSSPSNNSPF